mmetsp:Transcript_9652/g.23191  ORF Transcript_9652/g.23191 Transcript_9652/m.23191 type:complete len:170 (+) Transcript_9652:611-1120(+)
MTTIKRLSQRRPHQAAADNDRALKAHAFAAAVAKRQAVELAAIVKRQAADLADERKRAAVGKKQSATLAALAERQAVTLAAEQARRVEAERQQAAKLAAERQAIHQYAVEQANYASALAHYNATQAAHAYAEPVNHRSPAQGYSRNSVVPPRVRLVYQQPSAQPRRRGI